MKTSTKKSTFFNRSIFFKHSKKLALLFILFSSTLSVYSQCDVNNKYDKLISGYHSSIALKDNGTYAIWGSSMSEMGADVLSPQDIDATNYADLNGRTVYKAALGGNKSGASVDQAIILTDNGLWAWGVNGMVLKSAYTLNSNPLTTLIGVPGANSYGLPPGVVPTSVNSLFATYQTLMISTDSGFVYMLTQSSLAVEANGGTASSAGTSIWKKVKINASTYLTNVVSVRGQVSSSSYSAFMAVTASGAVYTWGNTTYLGDNSASAARNYATQMTLPAEFASSVPAMISVTGGIGQAATTKNTYYILSNAGNLYTLGDNSLRQCGDFTTTEKTSWVRVQKSATPGDYLTNINTISVQEHNSSYPGAAAITSTGVLYTWGVNSSGMIGRTDNGTLSGTMTTVSFDPGVPVGFSVANDQALTVEVGGHTLVYTKVGSNQFCYVGHQISGSMGDGTTTGAGTSSTNTMIYNCSSTPALAICGYVPVAADTSTSTIAATPTSIVANGTSTSTVTVTLKNASNTQLTTSGGIVVIYTTAGTIGSVTDNGNGTYTATLTSAITAGTATLSFSINGAMATGTAAVTFTGGTTYSIVSSAGANGSISPAGSTSVNSGGSQLYTFTPSAGYIVDSFFIDGVAQAAANTYSFTNVTANHTINVTFIVSAGGTTYSIVSSAGANGSISPAGSTSVNSGGSQLYTFTPSAGYAIDSLFIDGVAQAAANTFSFTNVTASHTINVSFKASAGGSSFSITSSAGANGSISPAGSTSVNSGGSQLYTFTPSAGYAIDSLFIDGVAQAAANTYSFTNVTSNHTIDVSFIVISFSGTNPVIAYNGAAAADTITFCSGSICPLNWGNSNYQWYLNGVALAAPYGTASCLDSVVDGSYTFAAQDGYGVWSSPSSPVYVMVDTTCMVTSGGSGGVESKTLGDVIAVRLYGNAINSVATTSINPIKFTPIGVAVDGINDINLSQLMPATVANTDAALVTTPTDLVNFTNAVEVLAVDYAKANTTKAVAFGTKTLGDVYSHTKPICDRLKGASILEVKTLNVRGHYLVAYKIQQCSGEIEYAINLSAGTAANRNTISLQSRWFTDDYQQDQKLYNFQLWAVNYDMVKSMANDILQKLEANGNITQANTANDLPRAYVTKGKRKGTNISLTIQNNTTATSGYVELREKLTETSNETIRIVPITNLPANQSTVQFDVKDAYEATINLFINNSKTDMLYLNDGTWSKDYSATTTVNNFTVSADGNANANPDEYRLMRNVAFNANTKDYFSVYKTIGTGCNALNISKYKSIKYTANAIGAGSVTITLVSSNITDWKNQFSYTMNLEGNQEYAISLAKFKSNKYNTLVNANEITAVNFSFNNSRAVPTSMTASLSKTRFSKLDVISTSLAATSLGIYPNPTMGKFTVAFTSEMLQPLVLKVTEAATGKIVTTQFINATKGANTIVVDNSLADGLYIVTLDGDDVKYNAAKLMVNRK